MAYYCHELIKKFSIELAGTWYETAARDDEIFKICPNQKEFIAKCWGHFIPLARVMMTKLLARPDIDDVYKEEIMEAIILDKTLPKDTAVNPQNITFH